VYDWFDKLPESVGNDVDVLLVALKKIAVALERFRYDRPQLFHQQREVALVGFQQFQPALQGLPERNVSVHPEVGNLFYHFFSGFLFGMIFQGDVGQHIKGFHLGEGAIEIDYEEFTGYHAAM
jgi:hypothetical protein